MTTVAEALTFYVKEKSHVAAPQRLEIAANHLTAILGKFQLQDIDLSTCKIYKKKRLQKVSLATVARELGVLKAAARIAVKWKLIKPDKMPIIEIPGNLPKRMVWLLKDESKKLYDYLTYHDELFTTAFIRLLYETASRRRAIETLEWSQINWANSTINLQKPGQKVTKKRRPTVPISKDLAFLLGAIFKEKKVNDYVFGSTMDRLRNFQTVLKIVDLETVKERDGRPAGKVTPHTLRHSRATHLLEAGMPIYTVAQLLGDNPLTVQRTYAHACTSNLEQDLKKFSV